MCNGSELEKLRAENARLNTELEKAQEEAVRDHMTGLYNRRKFDTELRIFANRCLNSYDKLSLILIDIDNFKSINDQFGHPAGDKVINAVAKVIMSHTREDVLSARYGGEEFAILVEDTAGIAYSIAERIRFDVQKIDLCRLLDLDKEIKSHVTISGGVKGFTGAGNDIEKAISMLVDGADKNLMIVKNNSKNATYY